MALSCIQGCPNGFELGQDLPQHTQTWLGPDFKSFYNYPTEIIHILVLINFNISIVISAIKIKWFISIQQHFLVEKYCLCSNFPKTWSGPVLVSLYVRAPLPRLLLILKGVSWQMFQMFSISHLKFLIWNLYLLNS